MYEPLMIFIIKCEFFPYVSMVITYNYDFSYIQFVNYKPNNILWLAQYQGFF